MPPDGIRAVKKKRQTCIGWSDPRNDPGELLWPDRFGPEEVATLKLNLGTYGYSGQCQQRPSPLGGGMFKRSWFKYWKQVAPTIIEYKGIRVEPMALSKFITVDLACSTKNVADWTVIAVWAFTQDNPRRLLLMDMHRERMEGPDIVPCIRRMMERWQASIVWIESSGFQLALVQQAKREGLPVRELLSDKDKVARALAATPMVECGRVYFPEKALWLADLEHELLTFPASKHDDMVDVVSYACRIGVGVPAAVPEIERAEKRGEFEEYQVREVDWKKDW